MKLVRSLSVIGTPRSITVLAALATDSKVDILMSLAMARGIG